MELPHPEKTSPLVSTVVISYNHGKFIDDTLKSIEKLNYDPIEVIIADNGSDDNSVEMIEKWIQNNSNKVTFLKKSSKMNLCALLNESFDKCNGKYIQMISCDDLFLEDKLKVQVGLMEKIAEDYAVLYSDAYLIDEKGTKSEQMFIERAQAFEDIPDGEIFSDLINGNFIPAMSVLIRKNVWEALGGFDEKLKYEDYDFWLRVARQYKFKFSDYPSCSYRIHSSNWHKSNDLKLENYWILKKHQDHTQMKEKIRDFGYMMYVDGKTKTPEYKDFIRYYGPPSGPNLLINIAIKLKISFNLLEKAHNLFR